jgi:hypothetical protein|tara:strand:- start:228 stop:443 length:216 start_codon:yes stop_codon:yes gene_type:complete
MTEFEQHVREELKKIEEKVDDNTIKTIRLEVKFDEYRLHTMDKRQMVKSFVMIVLGVVGSIIAFVQLSNFI